MRQFHALGVVLCQIHNQVVQQCGARDGPDRMGSAKRTDGSKVDGTATISSSWNGTRAYVVLKGTGNLPVR